MSNFKTYRVRYSEWQAFAINVSARSPNEACELARQIRSDIGQEPFEEIDGAIENFGAEELDAREFAEGGAAWIQPPSTPPKTNNPRQPPSFSPPMAIASPEWSSVFYRTPRTGPSQTTTGERSSRLPGGRISGPGAGPPGGPGPTTTPTPPAVACPA